MARRAGDRVNAAYGEAVLAGLLAETGAVDDAVAALGMSGVDALPPAVLQAQDLAWGHVDLALGRIEEARSRVERTAPRTEVLVRLARARLAGRLPSEGR